MNLTPFFSFVAVFAVAAAYRLGVVNERNFPGDRQITVDAVLGLSPESPYLQSLIGLLLVVAVVVHAAGHRREASS